MKNPRDTRIIHNCKYCNKEFLHRKAGTRKFCSGSCASNWNWSQKDYREKLKTNLFHKGRTPHNKLPRKEIICKNCKNKFIIDINSKRKFCSMKCSSDMSKGRKLTKEHIRKCLRRRPMSSLEVKFNNIITKYDLPYRFVGNGDFFIERKNPDFINTNGEKIAIEVFCRKHKCMFEKNKINNNIKDYSKLEEWKNNRSKIFSKYGWKILFFSEIDLNNENKILNIIGGY